MADLKTCNDGMPHAWHPTPGHPRYTAQCIKCGRYVQVVEK